MHRTVHNCCTLAQNRPDSFPPYPPDNHHCSDDVYLREGGHIAPPAIPKVRVRVSRVRVRLDLGLGLGLLFAALPVFE